MVRGPQQSGVCHHAVAQRGWGRGDCHDKTPEGRPIPGHRRQQGAGLVRRQGADRYDIQSTLWPLAAAGSVPDGRYSITCEGLAQATVSRQIADDVRQTQRISVDVGGGDAVALLATVLAVEAVRYEHDGTPFPPPALLENPPPALPFMLNPFAFG